MTDQIVLRDVQKHYGGFHALKDINLAIPKGQFTAFVGPSGCGKSTLLRSIAGLERITAGEVHVAGERVNDRPPRKRDLAMVFQSYALYPHMSVRDNLTYALRLKGVPRADRARAADALAGTIGLDGLLDRRPRELSGGQRQRVAMGRAIIREPKAFLFDEPLSNLDAALRVRMRKEVRALHDRIGATSVYVTHDQIEAMTMADHVVVLQAGRIEQQGPPMALYTHPANRFVAGFIGSPAMNFVPGSVTDDGQAVTLDMPGAPVLPIAAPADPGRAVTVGLRPEHLTTGAASGAGTITARIATVEPTGSTTYLFTDTAPELLITADGTAPHQPGENVTLQIAPGHVHLFDPDSGARLGA